MEIYQIIWFILWSVLWSVYFMLDGFDLGLGILFLTKDENKKKLYSFSIAPFWDGNEVWLITAAGATFAAFPLAYAKLFSWFYIPFFMLLLSLILRGFAVEFRSKIQNKNLVDTIIFLSSFFIVVLFGILFGNLYRGLNIQQNGFTGNIFSLFNFSAIITSIAFFVSFIFHSLLWILNRVNEKNLEIEKLLKKFYVLTGISFGLFLIFLPHRNNPSFGTEKVSFYLTILFYLTSFLAYLLIGIQLKSQNFFKSFILSLIFIFSFIAGGFSGIFPNIIPSSISPENSVSIYNSSSNPYTLKIMLLVAIIFVPIVIAYQIWVYKNLATKINNSDLNSIY